jgi:hypothetical protein
MQQQNPHSQFHTSMLAHRASTTVAARSGLPHKASSEALAKASDSAVVTTSRVPRTKQRASLNLGPAAKQRSRNACRSKPCVNRLCA